MSRALNSIMRSTMQPMPKDSTDHSAVESTSLESLLKITNLFYWARNNGGADSQFTNRARRALDLKVLSALVACVMTVGALATAQDSKMNAAPATTIATVHIPYQFSIEGTLLPAGDYTLSRVEDGVLFRNARAGAEEQAFLIPAVGQPVVHEHKLIFVLHDGQHYLREVWNSDGRQIITSELGHPLSPGDTQSEVKIVKVNSNIPQQGKAALR